MVSPVPGTTPPRVLQNICHPTFIYLLYNFSYGMVAVSTTKSTGIMVMGIYPEKQQQ
jgi:hypothetical protein